MSGLLCAGAVSAALFVVGLALGPGGATAGTAQASRATQGVYTKAQARRGNAVYQDVCVACHSLGRFRGADFAAKWTDKPLATLYKAVTSMPQGEPGSLDPQDYADVVAYLLSVNDYPAGAQELAVTPEAVAAIWLDTRVP